MHEEPDPYFVRIDATLAGRPPGGSASARAEELRRAAPWRSRLARVMRVHTDERAWRLGAIGERRVGAELSRLPSDRWFVLHDVPLGAAGANVDHLVVGEPGVFCLNAKNLGGTVWVGDGMILQNGRRTDFLQRARAEAEHVQRVLSAAAGRDVAVTPVLVILCSEMLRKGRPDDVAVVRNAEVRRWLLRRPPQLSRADVVNIASRAVRPETWNRF